VWGAQEMRKEAAESLRKKREEDDEKKKLVGFVLIELVLTRSIQLTSCVCVGVLLPSF
jgi:hypothetical protein